MPNFTFSLYYCQEIKLKIMIGVFDSGFGGLTILKELIKVLPEYDYYYFGDNARAPYGNRSPEAVQGYTDEAIEFLFKKGCKLVLVACNTATGLSLRHSQQKYLVTEEYKNHKILGVILPQVESAIKVSKNNQIGVVGTRGTINSKSFDIEFHKLNPDLKIFSQACPLLTPIIEEGWENKVEARMILKKYLKPLQNTQIDTLVLGCTHYPVMHKYFKRYMGKHVKIINPGMEVANSLKNYLARHPEVDEKLEKNSNLTITTSDDPERLRPLAERFLGLPIKNYYKVNLLG